MLRRNFLAVGSIATTIWATSKNHARAGDSGVARFPTTITAVVGGQPVKMTLTGSALRTKYLLRVYSVASYIQEGTSVRTADSLAKIDAAKQLILTFERDVDGSTMASSFRDAIGMSHPAPAFAAELTQLERYFVANPVKQGDQIRLTHIPMVGLDIQVNARPSILIRGVGFAQAAWGSYLGPNNLGVAIKEGLSSRLR